MDPISAAIALAILALGTLAVIIVIKITIERIGGWIRERLRRRNIDATAVSQKINQAISSGNVGHIKGVLIPFTYAEEDIDEKHEIILGLYDPDKDEVVEAAKMESDDIDEDVLEEHEKSRIVIYS